MRWAFSWQTYSPVLLGVYYFQLPPYLWLKGSDTPKHSKINFIEKWIRTGDLLQIKHPESRPEEIPKNSENPLRGVLGFWCESYYGVVFLEVFVCGFGDVFLGDYFYFLDVVC